MHIFFIAALKLIGISMCTVSNKFYRNVVEKAFIQKPQAQMSNQMSNLQRFQNHCDETTNESSIIPECSRLTW